MLRWVRRIVLVTVALLLGLMATGLLYQVVATSRDRKRFPPPGERIDVGGHLLHLSCSGEGSPTVILESPGGSSALGWIFVQPGVAAFARVCSYDRAGYGWSDSGPKPRTGLQIASELKSLIEGAELPGPFVLVGSSVGGCYVRILASLMGDRVAGMVLVESVHEDQNARLPESARISPALLRTFNLLRVASRLGLLRLTGTAVGEGSMDALPEKSRAMARAAGFRTSWIDAIYHETAAVDESLAQLDAASPIDTTPALGDRPLVVLTHGKSEAETEEDRVAERVWAEMQQELLTLSSNSTQVIAGESGHFIQVDQPDLVIEAIRKVVEEARDSKY